MSDSTLFLDISKAIAELIVDEPKSSDEWWAGCHGDEEYYYNKRIKYAGEIQAIIRKIWEV